MTAGLNIKVDIIRPTQRADTPGGGSTSTGTTIGCALPAALAPQRPAQVLLQQGLEVETTYEFTIRSTALSQRLRERDEIEVVWPLDHLDFGNRFRVMGVQTSRRRHKYGATHATVARTRYSRSTSV